VAAGAFSTETAEFASAFTAFLRGGTCPV
jgi:hypothetical protein